MGKIWEIEIGQEINNVPINLQEQAGKFIAKGKFLTNVIDVFRWLTTKPLNKLNNAIDYMDDGEDNDSLPTLTELLFEKPAMAVAKAIDAVVDLVDGGGDDDSFTKAEEFVEKLIDKTEELIEEVDEKVEEVVEVVEEKVEEVQEIISQDVGEVVNTIMAGMKLATTDDMLKFVKEFNQKLEAVNKSIKTEVKSVKSLIDTCNKQNITVSNKLKDLEKKFNNRFLPLEALLKEPEEPIVASVDDVPDKVVEDIDDELLEEVKDISEGTPLVPKK